LKSLEEIYSNESGKPIDVKLLDLEEIHIDNSNLDLSEKLIYENALEIFQDKLKTIFLGGDHAVSYPIGKAFVDFCKQNDKEPCFIVFDSHPDCMPCENRKNPNHEEWLRSLIEEKGLKNENVLLVGARNSDKEEIEFLNKNKIRVISMNQMLEDLNDSCDIIMEFANGKELYLSLDIDVIEPSFAPATGYIEPGGLTSRQFLYLIQRINKIKNLKAVDIVEINPEKDKEFNMITTKLGAKILGELI
jgi:agmatinase